MTFPLSFADEFFWGDGSPPLEEMQPPARPTCVCHALASFSDQEWVNLAREEFGCELDYLDIETVLQRIVSTNTCRNLDAPVEVFIDPEGFFTVLVHEKGA